jgi:hypothetical protein
VFFDFLSRNPEVSHILTSAQQALRRQDAEAGLVWADVMDDSEGWEIVDSDGGEDDSYESVSFGDCD